jgi:HAD superfamily hydrolase (TIGR01490 family)
MVAEQHTSPRVAAFFDVDRTLVRGSSLLKLARPMRAAGLLPTRVMLQSLGAQARFTRFGYDEQQIREAVRGAGALVAGLESSMLLRFAQTTVPVHVLPAVYPRARALMEWHRSRGHLVFVVSSSPRQFISVLGDLLGVDGVAATEAEIRDGRYTGRITRFCHGPAKAESVRELAAARGVDLPSSFAYGDSLAGDLEMLSAVGHPVCVNPDRALERWAISAGWPIERFEAAGTPPRGLARFPRQLVSGCVPAARRVRGHVRRSARSLREL